MTSIQFDFDTSSLSIPEIAERSGRSYHTIYGLCRNHKLPYTKKPTRLPVAKSEGAASEVIAMYQNGKSMAEIGIVVGYTPATILALLRKHNIPTRLKSGHETIKPPMHPRETLEALYVTEGKSLHEIADILGYPNGSGVSRDLQLYGIVRRSYSAAGKMKYKTDPDFRKRIQAIFDKNRIGWLSKKKTWIEEWCEEWCKDAGLDFIFQYQIPDHKLTSWKCKHCFDFYIPALNLLVEMDGEYWHKDSGTRDALYDSVAIAAGYDIVRISDRTLKKHGMKAFDEAIFKSRTVTNDDGGSTQTQK